MYRSWVVKKSLDSLEERNNETHMSQWEHTGFLTQNVLNIKRKNNRNFPFIWNWTNNTVRNHKINGSQALMVYIITLILHLPKKLNYMYYVEINVFQLNVINITKPVYQFNLTI